MKKLCSIVIDGKSFDYLLDIGKRSKSYLAVRDGVVSVRLPFGGTQRAAEEMIRSNIGWIRGKLRQSEERSRLPESFGGGETFSLLGKKYKLVISESPVYREPQLDEDKLTVFVSPNMTETDAERLFLRYVSSVCEQRVKLAFDKYIPVLGLAPRRITIKKMTSRWGSCSSNGNISINSDIICFEQECIDYVAVHELCHLKYMDHGKDFWALVSTCCPDYKRLRERMKH